MKEKPKKLAQGKFSYKEYIIRQNPITGGWTAKHADTDEEIFTGATLHAVVIYINKCIK